MGRKTPPSQAFDPAAFDQALGAVVASGWNEQPPPVIPQEPLQVVAMAAQTQELAYPPLPIDPEREEPAPGGAERSEGDLSPGKALLDVGLLSDLVAGAKTPDQAAAAAGVTLSELHSALATTLARSDPKELARAMGVQVTASQLKATAVWNALLADILEDIRMGRVKADVKLELLKVLGKIGRLEPKEDKNVSAGSGFQLNINIGDGAKPVVIESQ